MSQACTRTHTCRHVHAHTNMLTHTEEPVTSCRGTISVWGPGGQRRSILWPASCPAWPHGRSWPHAPLTSGPSASLKAHCAPATEAPGHSSSCRHVLTTEACTPPPCCSPAGRPYGPHPLHPACPGSPAKGCVTT